MRHKNINEIEGIVRVANRYIAFLDTRCGKRYPIEYSSVSKVMEGDIVLASVFNDENGRAIAKVEVIVTAGLGEFVGRIVTSSNAMFVDPDRPSSRSWVYVLPSSRQNLKEGDWVHAKLEHHPFTGGRPSAVVNYIVARKEDRKLPWVYAIAQNNIIHDENGLERTPVIPDYSSRVKDLTDLAFLTIDASSTRDMDDALHVENLSDGKTLLSVAITDVSGLLCANKEVDEIAKNRAFSIYLPGKVIPMIPAFLSEGLLSLVEGERRAVVCCQILIDELGRIESYKFIEAIISSAAKLSYFEVGKHLDGEIPLEYGSEISKQIDMLKLLSDKRRRWREDNSLVFNDNSPEYIFDMYGYEVNGIHAHYRNMANKVVEECMITANICCADLLSSRVGKGVFSSHSGINEKHLYTIRSLSSAEGLDIESSEILTLDGYIKIRRFIQEKKLTYFNLRVNSSHSSTVYSESPLPHFGMGLRSYATFTSPIRRYGDVINQRLIKDHIRGQSSDTDISETITNIQLSLERAKRAEADVKRWLYSRYLSDSIGKEFQAEVKYVTRGGCVLKLKENGASVFVPKSKFDFNIKDLRFDTGTGRVYNKSEKIMELGSKVKVVISEVNEEKRNIIASFA